MQLSPDGQWYWDGTQWRSTYSPDGLWRWDGRQWVPARPGAQQWRYQPTVWTRWLQGIVLALQAIGVVFAITVLPAVLQRSLDVQLRSQYATSGIDPAQLQSVMDATIQTSLVIGGIVGAVILIIVVIGTLRLWAWLYWLLVVVYLIAVLSVLQNIVYAVGQGPVVLPGWFLLLSIPLGLVQGALGVWMIILYRRYGTWARKRVPVNEP